MIACLSMYRVDPDLLDGFWAVVAASLRAAGVDGVPDRLTPLDDVAASWQRPDLLLGQTCGYPLVTWLAGRVRVLGAFRYTAPGCSGIDYASRVVVRADDPAETLAELRDRVAALNSRDSHSGCNALRALVAPLARNGRFFREVVVSGAHRRSVDLVRSGAADVAAIDTVSLALMARDEPDRVRGLRVLATTAAAPGLPLVTAAAADDRLVALLRQALAQAVADPATAASRQAMLVEGFEAHDAGAWARCRFFAESAARRGYAELA